MHKVLWNWTRSRSGLQAIPAQNIIDAPAAKAVYVTSKSVKNNIDIGIDSRWNFLL